MGALVRFIADATRAEDETFTARGDKLFTWIDKDTRAEVWLAKERFNFPVRVVFDDPKGIKLEQTLENLQQR